MTLGWVDFPSQQTLPIPEVWTGVGGPVIVESCFSGSRQLYDCQAQSQWLVCRRLGTKQARCDSPPFPGLVTPQPPPHPPGLGIRRLAQLGEVTSTEEPFQAEGVKEG